MKAKKSIPCFLLFFLVVASFVGVSFAQRGLENFRWLGSTGLAISGQPDLQSEWDTLYSWGIRATVNLCAEKEDDKLYLQTLRIDYFWFPVTDGTWDSTITNEQINTTVNWIDSELSAGKKVLIHCAWGRGRGPTLAMMWYVHEGHTPSEAESWVVQYPISSPADIQKQAVRSYYYWLQQLPEPADQPLPQEVLVILAIVGASVLLFLLWKDKLRKKSRVPSR